jgi:hypothetical protein
VGYKQKTSAHPQSIESKYKENKADASRCMTSADKRRIDGRWGKLGKMWQQDIAKEGLGGKRNGHGSLWPSQMVLPHLDVV